jgi:hypothetical protein
MEPPVMVYRVMEEYFRDTGKDIFEGNKNYEVTLFRYSFDDPSFVDYVSELRCTMGVLSWILPFLPESVKHGDDSIFHSCVKFRICNDGVLHFFMRSKKQDPSYFRIHLRVFLDAVDSSSLSSSFSWKKIWSQQQQPKPKPLSSVKRKFRLIIEDVQYDLLEFNFKKWSPPPLFDSILRSHIQKMLENDLKWFSKQISLFLQSKTSVPVGDGHAVKN